MTGTGLRLIAKDANGLWDYYQASNGAVFYDGTFRGCKAGFFGDSTYWQGHLSRAKVLHGPWPPLEKGVPGVVLGLACFAPSIPEPSHA